MPKVDRKRKPIEFTIEPEEIDMVGELADLAGLPRSQFVSFLIRRAHAEHKALLQQRPKARPWPMEHASLLRDVFDLMTYDTAILPSEIVGKIGHRHPADYVGWNVNAALDFLAFDGLIDGAPVPGYTLTPRGRAVRGY